MADDTTGELDEAWPVTIHAPDDLAHWTRRMLQALDGYWLHYEGWNGAPDRHPRSESGEYEWWCRFEKYRARVEARL